MWQVPSEEDAHASDGGLEVSITLESMLCSEVTQSTTGSMGGNGAGV